MINRLDVFREGQLLTSFDIDENTVFSDKLQREVLITCPVAAEQALPLQENDYIEYDEELFVINTLPEFEKDGAWTVRKYNIVFEAELFHLLDTFVLDSFGKAVFSYYASANGHLQMMVANANRNGFDWQVEEVDETIEVNIDYNWTYVRTALDQIAEAFGLEWKIKGKKMRMVKSVGRDTGLTFEVGRSKGLHQIKRTSDASKSRPTRVWGIGGSLNIDANYRDGSEKTLVFDGYYVQTPGVTAGTERVKESKYVNEGIYPHFKGTVGNTSVLRNVAGEIISFTIIDLAIDFDINVQLAQTSKEFKAKVGFLTGPLTGVEFEISKYDHATRAVTIIPTTDTNGYILPNDLNLPEIGNKFTFYDFKMPQAYYTNAEKELKDKTLEFLNDGVSLTFSAKPDEKHLRDNDIRLRSGDRATVIEADINVNEVLRFTEISFPLVNPYNVTTVISSEIKYDKVVKLFADVIQTKQQLYTVERRNIELEKRATQNLRAFELSIFDTDGMFDSKKLNTGVLSAALGIYGTKSQNFKLSKVYITDNYQYDPSKVYISGGELIHFEYANGSQNVWQMQPLTQAGLVSSSLYYVYAKCNKASQVGSFVATTSQIKVEDVAGFYHFLAGVLYPVNAGYRDSDFTNGIADINGNRLKIGKIVSRDGLTWFDLDNGEFRGKFKFSSGIEIEQAFNDLADTSASISNYLTAVLPTELADLQNQIDGTIESFFFQYDPTTVNAPANNWDTPELKVKHGNDTFTNTSTGQSWRWLFENGEWIWKVITDTATQQALLLAGQAKDTADSKRRNFVVQPFAPYEQGDTWSQGPNGDILRCVTTRLLPEGAYNAADWDKSSKYTDDTVALEAKNEAENAKNTADAVAEITDFLTTTVDGNIVASGTMLVGDAAANNNAGITGVVDEGDDSVRFWSGDTYENKNVAPWRVLNNGREYAQDIVIARSTQGRRSELNSLESTYTFYDDQDRVSMALRDDAAYFTDDDNTQKPLAGIEFRKIYQSNPSNPDIVAISGNGIYSNTGFVEALTNVVGTGESAFGSVIGYVRRAITLAFGSVHAGIVGLAATNNSFGGYFKHLFTGGISLFVQGLTQLNGGQIVSAKTVTNGYTCTDEDYLLVYTQTSGTINLPTTTQLNGRVFKFLWQTPSINQTVEIRDGSTVVGNMFNSSNGPITIDKLELTRVAGTWRITA